MNHHLKPLMFLLILTCIAACRDKSKQEPSPQPVDFSENYQYYPIQNGREWTYETTITDSIKGTTDVIKELARYNQAGSRTDYYRDSVLWSYTYWSNSGNKLSCCVDVVLLDYSQLNCNSDSVLIYQKNNGSYTSGIYQYCEKKLVPEVPNYSKIECIKTVQVNQFTQGNYTIITQYFGHGVGLVYRQQRIFDKSGKLKTQETQKLISKNF